jgi:tetratricopeptide (TPR) repeat protein
MKTSNLVFLLLLFLVLPLTDNFAQENFEQILAQGMQLEKADNFEQAVEYYQNACKDNPLPQIYSRLVSLLGKLKKYDEALLVSDEALSKFPSDVGLLNLQGLLAIRSNDTEKALKSWSKVLKIDPDNKFAKKNLKKIKPVADIQVASSEASEAEEEEKPVLLSLEEQKKVAKGNLETIAQLEEDDIETMKNLYRDIIDRCPDTIYAPEACWRMANIFIISENPSDYSSAAEFLELLLKLYPEKPIPSYIVRTRIVNCYEQTKEFDKVSVHLRAIIDGYPEMPAKDKINFIFRYAEALNGAGQTDNAQALYQQIISEGEPHSSAVILAKKRLEN